MATERIITVRDRQHNLVIAIFYVQDDTITRALIREDVLWDDKWIRTGEIRHYAYKTAEETALKFAQIATAIAAHFDEIAVCDLETCGIVFPFYESEQQNAATGSND